MAVRFVMGPAGSGKTHYCIEQIKEALLERNRKEKLVFLVPEQATYQIESAILRDERIGGYSDAYIVSFNRLGFWVSQTDILLEPLTKTAKFLIISRILRENASRLKVFHTMADQPGMVDKVASMITELYQCGKTSIDLMDVIRRHEQLSLSEKMTLEKLADIALIYDEYVDYLTGRFENPDQQLAIIKREIASSELFKGARLWVDGFSSFTQAEYDVLTELFKVCSQANITLCMENQSQRPDVFKPIIETKNKLENVILKNGIELESPVEFDEIRRFRSDELKWVEKNIFSESEAGATVSTNGNLLIANPLNVNNEVEYIVDKINSLVFNDGYRYRDIAVILNDMDAYEVYLRQIFGDFKIPFFLDKRRSCLQHPLVHLLISAMRVITGGFERVDIFSFLKNSLVMIDKTKVQMLENYCLSEGIEKKHWLGDEAWKSHAAYGLDSVSLNELKQKASADLRWLNHQLSEEIEAGVFSQVMQDFLGRLNVSETLNSWLEKSQEFDAGEIDHAQVYSQVNQVLSEIAVVFAGDKMPAEIFIGCFCDSLSAITSSLIPPGQDQVIISEIDRSRLPDVKAVFIAGAVAKKFPLTITDASLLTDYDRQFSCDEGCELEQGREVKLRKKNYLAYIALTRASEKLFISWPKLDKGGKKQQRSDVISDVISMFDGLEVSAGINLDDINRLTKSWQLKDYLCINGGRNNFAKFSGVDIEPVQNEIKKVDILSDCIEPLRRASVFDNGSELDDKVKELLGSEIFETSVTKLQTYSGCPYKYFARYVLGLKPREQFVYDPLKKGVFYHDLFDMVSKHLIAASLGFNDIDEAELVSIARDKIEQIRSKDEHLDSIIRSSRHNMFIFESMVEEAMELLRSLRLMAEISSFKLAVSEMDFGFGKNSGFEIVNSRGRKILLKGKIDRVDIHNNTAVVYDYKSQSKPSLDWLKLYHGLELQLPVYMLAINASMNGASKDTKAVASFYIPIRSQAGSGRSSDKLGSVSVRKPRGIYNGDYYNLIDSELDCGQKSKFYAMALKNDGGFNKNSSGDMLDSSQVDQLLAFTVDKISDICESIISGDISIRPFNLNGALVCEYCDYKPVCRFDRQLNESKAADDMGRDKKKGFFELVGVEENSDE
ncbi:MAG: PD-(D/E)XK nuclease family protein [Sedimentisphaeraceae bacterium JB056]